VEKQSKEMINLINERKREFIQRVENEEDIPGSNDTEVYPQQPPPPGPPSVDKIDIYSDPLEFADIDQIAISVRLLQNPRLYAVKMENLTMFDNSRLHKKIRKRSQTSCVSSCPIAGRMWRKLEQSSGGSLSRI